ncbi:MAG: glycosyltransferase family 4 protein [Bacteroidetes bacterium]|nr:glycosyltransferase family 4 protein [Bacteroidota bacterium]
MPKQILLVYAKSSVELLNRQSALGSYIFCLCEILQKNGINFFVNGIPFDELKQQITSKNKNIQPNNKFKKYIPKILKEVARDIILFKNIKKLSKNIFTKRKYDCVLEFYNYASDVGLKVSNQQNIPLIVVYDAPVLEEYIFFHGYKYFFKNKILRRELKTLLYATHIVAYSNAVKNYINQLASKKLPISLHQNVDFTRFDFLEKKFDQKSIKIGFIGSFLKWHRIDLLLQAFYKLREQNNAVELFLIGNGMEYDSIKESVRQSPFKQFITMFGFLDGEKLLDIKKQLHIGVMPGSNWYGAPNKIFEYGAAKMAVVAPSTPTITDLFEDKKDLLFFKQDDLNDLYQKLKTICDDVILSEQLATVLQQKIKHTYSEQNTYEFYSHLIINSVLKQ